MLIKSKVFLFLSKNHPKPTNFQSLRTFIDNLEIKFVADRGLDHAVEKEKDLKGVLNLKNLLKCEPSKSLSLSSIVDNIDKLEIPCRAIDFIRKYPSIFEEYFPANIAIHPHVRLTPESLNLDAEEQLIYGTDLYRKSAADRLLKLIMLCRINEIPLELIDKFKWDLGFPDNYIDLLVPEFPDYFRVKRVNNRLLNRSNRVESLLELVCWSDELAVSFVEKRAMKEEPGYKKGMPIAFPLQFSTGFVMDKEMKRWMDEWQRLPYVSPYENAFHLQPNSDASDKWVVAVLHELLHIFMTKKTERDYLLCFGEFLGIKPRVKRVLAHHPGIFYRSSKIGTHTMVLREGYKRGLLIDKHPLIDMRNKYVHLMHKVKEVKKVKGVASPSAGKKQAVKGATTEKGEDNANGCEEAKQFSDADVDESNDDEEDDEVEVQVENSTGRQKNGRRGSFEVKEGGRKHVEGGRGPGRYTLQDESGNYDDDDEDEDEEEQVGRSRGGRKFERRGSGKVTEGGRKPGEERGRPRKNTPWDGRGSNNFEKQVGGSRDGRQNGRRGSGKVFEDRRKPGEGRGRSRRNASWDVRGDGDGDGEDRVQSSRGGHRNGREPGKVDEDRRKLGDCRGRRGKSFSRGEGGDGDHQNRVDSSRDAHNYGRRGSSKIHEGRRRPGESNERPGRNGSRERPTQKFTTRT